MKQFESKLPILIDKFSQHNLYKDRLLDYFNNNKIIDKNFQGDNISNFDWQNSTDFKREWVKMIYEDLHKHFLKYANHMGFSICNINNLWFQQYNKNSTHGWHVHGHNYTGVYYVNFNKDCAKTRLLDSYTKSYYTDIEAQEGDIIIFPSIVIHRALTQNINFLKTIISFNISFDEINTEIHNNTEENIRVIK
jgi:hypothetical protein